MTKVAVSSASSCGSMGYEVRSASWTARAVAQGSSKWLRPRRSMNSASSASGKARNSAAVNSVNKAKLVAPNRSAKGLTRCQPMRCGAPVAALEKGIRLEAKFFSRQLAGQVLAIPRQTGQALPEAAGHIGHGQFADAEAAGPA